MVPLSRSVDFLAAASLISLAMDWSWTTGGDYTLMHPQTIGHGDGCRPHHIQSLIDLKSSVTKISSPRE